MALAYQEIVVPELSHIDTESQAQAWFWQMKYEGKAFSCRVCSHEKAYEHASRPEVKTCRLCGAQTRLRAGTALEKTRTPFLTITRMVFLMMQDKRGASALSLQRQLRMSSYGTTWSLLQKVRSALAMRNREYKLDGTVEVDGAEFGREARRGETAETRAVIGVQTILYQDKQGKTRKKAGFARCQMVATESGYNVAGFGKSALLQTAIAHTDGNRAFASMPIAKVVSVPMRGDKEKLDRWLPLVHRLTANAKCWMMGTHHGVGTLYLSRYLNECFFRFNRRHDPNTLWHRALRACAVMTRPAKARLSSVQLV